MSKHTPGPWKYDGDGFDSCASADCGTDGYTVMDDDCFPICQIDDRINDDESEANARLIAAAPELLAALVELLAQVDEQANAMGWPDNTPREQARAAIAKATGAA